MKDSYIIQSIDADLTDVLDRINQLNKLIEGLSKKIAKQQETIDKIIDIIAKS